MSIDRFLSWFQSTSVNTKYLKVSYSNSYGFGVYSNQRINEKDFLILSIPEHLFLKPSFENPELTGFEQLIIYLLENPTHPYIEFLQTIQPIPLWCSYLNENYPRQLKQSMTKHLNKYNQSRNKLQQYSENHFQWAYYTINTRCVHFNMEMDLKDQDSNLCLIPYLDFVNHSIQPNTISTFNQLTRSYEIRSTKSIDLNEQITFLYNPHSNIDLFIEYGFVLSSNPSNELNIEYELTQILSNEQIQLIKSFDYWNTLAFYSGDNDLSWTIIKSIELIINQEKWSPYDDPSLDIKQQLINKIKSFLDMVQLNVEKDFQQWTTDHFSTEKSILFNDFLTIISDTSLVIDKSILDNYILLLYILQEESQNSYSRLFRMSYVIYFPFFFLAPQDVSLEEYSLISCFIYNNIYSIVFQCNYRTISVCFFLLCIKGNYLKSKVSLDIDEKKPRL